MTSPISNQHIYITTPHSSSAPPLWETPAFYLDRAHVYLVLQEIQGSAPGSKEKNEAIDSLLSFLTTNTGNRVLTYDKACHDGAKNIICDAGNHNLSVISRGHLNIVCVNQGWSLVPG
jgi:hypothetical protein